jgi:pimeloyl-ACP methyl ester carboxylesterase
MPATNRHDLTLPHPLGGHLAVTVSGPTPLAGPVLVYVHGFGSVRSGAKAVALEAECASRGWSFLAADFRGHGESSGTMLDLRGSGLQADLDVLLDFLAGQGITRVFPVGSSMGGWATAWLAARRPEAVPACVLMAPALRFLDRKWNRLSKAEREEYRRTGRLRVRNDWIDVEVGYGLAEERTHFAASELFSRWATSALLIHGMRDRDVPHADSVEFIESVTRGEVELHLIREADHRLTGYEAVVAKLACDFLARYGA